MALAASFQPSMVELSGPVATRAKGAVRDLDSAGDGGIRAKRMNGKSMNLNEIDLGRYAPYLFRSIANRLGQLDSSFLSEHFGIGLNEWSCLTLLGLESDIPATRICEVGGFDKAVVSRSINSMEAKGLVVTALAPNRKRLRLINLTPAGRQLYRDTRAYAQQRQLRLLAGLSAAESADLLHMLNIVHANIHDASISELASGDTFGE
ncbi:DNA-binding MarR family transcriptional regulator [Novosphingobium capsulatum]|uniref:DNA-binding MarR family transcriptional regulator n=1 Tax=Novosphingobium capsulatum TaxID=13688 RepID=A0ABU1MRX1_9SPHN|nr:MarR family winged helix-turn-helix transcriptional regulator [Novosphingobium capsulatum]MDR6513095.1 DNA-binding MarR family transcriptional regulator [Novosphingobium capsulatum]